MKKEYLKLAAEAKKAMKKAYCPYSSFSVGAAVLTETGGIYTGANIENASYGLSCCAERVAVFKAVSSGAKAIKAVAVACSGKKAAMPCGACRQVISEFGRNADIVIAGKRGIKTVRLAKLLPYSFGKGDLR